MGKKKNKFSYRKKNSGGWGKGFKRVLLLGMVVISLMLVLFLGQPVIDAVPLFHILMTLGGLETYQDTVTGVAIILLLVGLFLIAIED